MGARRAVPLSLFSVYVLTVSETSTSAVPSRPIHRPRSLPPPELPALRLPRPRRRAEGAMVSAVASQALFFQRNSRNRATKAAAS